MLLTITFVIVIAITIDYHSHPIICVKYPQFLQLPVLRDDYNLKIAVDPVDEI